MTRGRLYVVLLASLIAILAFKTALMKPPRQSPAAAADSESPNARASDRPSAPELSLPIDAGKAPVSLASLKGKVVVLDFWATWCGPCRDSIPELEKFYQKYRSKGLEVVGISVDRSHDPVPGAVKELGMSYPVVMANDVPNIRDKYQFGGIPQMYVIDRKGRIAAQLEGYPHDLEAEVAPFIQE